MNNVITRRAVTLSDNADCMCDRLKYTVLYTVLVKNHFFLVLKNILIAYGFSTGLSMGPEFEPNNCISENRSLASENF